MARRYFDDGCAQTLGEQPLGVGWKGLIVNGTMYHEGRDFQAGTPITSLNAGGQRLLNGVEDSRLDRIGVGREMVHKVVL